MPASSETPGSAGAAYNGAAASTKNTSTASAHTHTFTTAEAGGDEAHNNMPPVIVLNYIIKT